MYNSETDYPENDDRMESKNNNRNLVLLSVIVNILLASLSGYLILEKSQVNNQMTDYVSKINELTESTINLEQQLNMTVNQLDYYKELADYYSEISTNEIGISNYSGFSTIPIVAVKTIQRGFRIEYEGVVMEAEIELVEGEGRILVDTIPKIGIDIQTSVRTAVMIVEELTDTSLTNTDIILTVRSSEEVEVVDGQSAGAAITTAILAASTNQSINEGIYMTGTINSDGSIGPVGGIPEKALAAAENGSNQFLVPQGQSTIIVYESKINRNSRGRSIITYEKKTMELEDYLKEKGYSVIVNEVETIEDAYTLFFN
jgi:uncharacterized protein